MNNNQHKNDDKYTSVMIIHYMDMIGDALSHMEPMSESIEKLHDVDPDLYVELSNDVLHGTSVLHLLYQRMARDLEYFSDGHFKLNIQDPLMDDLEGLINE